MSLGTKFNLKPDEVLWQTSFQQLIMLFTEWVKQNTYKKTDARIEKKQEKKTIHMTDLIAMFSNT